MTTDLKWQGNSVLYANTDKNLVYLIESEKGHFLVYHAKSVSARKHKIGITPCLETAKHIAKAHHINVGKC